MIPGHFRWPTNVDIPLFLELVDSVGEGVTGKTPQVSIRRYKNIEGGLLDNYYWDGAAFIDTPYWHDLSEVDVTDHPGLYTYLFEQSLVGLEIQYLAYYRHLVTPIGFNSETHLVTNEIYIPHTQPDPIVVGPDSIMGQLELMKDGGTALFDGMVDSLHFLNVGIGRVLGLLHQNAMVDNQVYDPNNQLTYARLRVFDDEANVPATPGGSETTGLLYEYNITAEYAGFGLVSNFNIKKVL